MRVRHALATLAIAWLPAAMPAAALAADGEAKGVLSVAGKGVPLRYAYAVPQERDEVLVIVSDAALGTKALADVFERIRLADDGRLHAVEMTIGPDHRPRSVSLRHNTFRVHGGGFSTDDRFDPTAFDGSRVAGRVWRGAPGDFFGVRYTFDATFAAPMWREPPPTFTGVAATASPQAKAALAFFAAGRVQDVAALKRTVVASRVAELDGPQGRRLQEFFRFAPDLATATVTRVDVEGETADVTLEQQSANAKETTTVRLKREAGQWKVSP